MAISNAKTAGRTKDCRKASEFEFLLVVSCLLIFTFPPLPMRRNDWFAHTNWNWNGNICTGVGD
uniref:Uncharacterized protein n=1 Tax=Triticum urartu TaxID=4572 RepID=A0A8R7QWB4_TRIUA